MVIHFIHSNEMKDMGGLRKYLPITNLSFLIACLAIAGIPPFAGFFSKEEILLAAYNSNQIVYWVALFTSGLTAFYMFRLYFSIFWNKPTEVHNHHGEGPFSMKLPLVILAILSVLAGFIPFGEYVSSDRTALESHFDPMFSIAPVAFGVFGILLAIKPLCLRGRGEFIIFRRQGILSSGGCLLALGLKSRLVGNHAFRPRDTSKK